MILLAMVTPDTRKAVLEVAAVEELVHHLGDDRAQKSQS
jgi:hypothetical protein